ncbi:MAG: regulatory protein GemA [Gammaproteobacteria bacterium]
MDDETYRDMLFTIARVRSAADLDAQGRQDVLRHLRACGFRGKPARPRHHPGAPHNIDSDVRGPMLKKIEAYLAEAKRPWSYVDGMAQHMFHVDRVAMCGPQQLRKIIAALDYDARRHGRYRGAKS